MRKSPIADAVFGLARRLVRRPQPDAAMDDVELVAGSHWFDRAFYLSAHADVAQSGLDPALHYLRYGAAEGRNPSERFDTAFYLAANPDVAAMNLNPLAHFIRHGEHEGRLPCAPEPSSDQRRGRAADAGTVRAAWARGLLDSGCFDMPFYLSQLDADEGAVESELEAIEHYLASGSSRGLAPAAWFDGDFYLRRYQDVEAAGHNPFWHFVAFGWKELRQPASDIDPAWLMLTEPRLSSAGSNLLQFLREHGADARIRRASAGAYSHNEKVRMVAAAPTVLSRSDLELRTLYALGQRALKIGSPSLALRCFLAAADGQPEDTRYVAAAARAHRLLNDWAAWAQVLGRLVLLEPDSPSYHFDLGVARQRLGELHGARDALARSLRLGRRPEAAYQLARVCAELGDAEAATKALETCIRLTRSNDPSRLYGPGALHEAYGNHVDALEAYKSRLLLAPPELHAALWYRVGRASERLLRWRDADQAYRRAATLHAGAGKAAWHFRIGFANERMGQLDVAAVAYRAALLLSARPEPIWEYRLGSVLQAGGRHLAAAHSFLRSCTDTSAGSGDPALLAEEADEQDDAVGRYLRSFCHDDQAMVTKLLEVTEPDVRRWIAAGDRHFITGDYPAAARSYLAAVSRDDMQSPSLYERAGRALLRAGAVEQGAAALRHVRRLRRPYLAGADAVDQEPALLLAAIYLECLETEPLDSKTILYESFSGLSVACNPLALFRHIADNPAFDGYTHVWVINDRTRVPDDIVGRENVILVSRDSYAYVKWLATAGYLINNSGFPAYFVRRDGQRNLATWHGTPLKTLGKEQKYKFYDHKRTQRNLLHASHIITPNPHTTRVELDGYEIRQLYCGKFAETGYPRVDLTLNADGNRQDALRRRLSIDADRKVVLYAPTWRGTPDEVWFDFDKLQEDLNALAVLDCQVLFRGHSWLERAINAAHVQCNVVPADIDTNELLSIVDVLVTDYSSVFFDFFATGRPVVYYIYDLEQYMLERGLYFDMEEMPGFKCRNLEELTGAVQQALAQPDAVPRPDGQFNLHDDGNACSRVVDFFFRDDAGAHGVDLQRSARRRVLMHAGAFGDDRRTRWALEFANALDAEHFELFVAFTPSAVELTASGCERFRLLPPGVVGLPRYGQPLMTPEERWLRRRYESGRVLGSEDAACAVKRAYEREFYRLTGGASFDVVVVFDEDGGFWTRMMLDGRGACAGIRVSASGDADSLAGDTFGLRYRDLDEQGVRSLTSLVATLVAGGRPEGHRSAC